MRFSKIARVVTALVAALGVLAGCGTAPVVVRNQSAGSTFFIDGWDQAGEEGDQALVEKKPSGLWVIAKEAPTSPIRTGEFQVEVRLDPANGFTVVKLNGVKVGKDHDDCVGLEEQDVRMNPAASTLVYEPEVSDPDTSSDDCVVGPED